MRASQVLVRGRAPLPRDASQLVEAERADECAEVARRGLSLFVRRPRFKFRAADLHSAVEATNGEASHSKGHDAAEDIEGNIIEARRSAHDCAW